MIFFIMYGCASDMGINDGGGMGGDLGMWDMGQACFTMVVIIANIRLMVVQYVFTPLQLFITFLSMAVWFGIALFLSAKPNFGSIFQSWDTYRVFDKLVNAGFFWFALLL